jgi:hypothetical protein
MTPLARLNLNSTTFIDTEICCDLYSESNSPGLCGVGEMPKCS